MSNPSEEDWKRMSKLVDSFFNRADAVPFREPVAWKEMGLMDYPQIIKHPMDLGTVKDKLKNKKYNTLFQVHDDVRRVWTNCMTYNADGSDFYKLADSLQKKWDDKYTKLLQDCGVDAAGDGASAVASSGAAASGSGNQNKASLQERRNFAKSLYMITKEDLGKILVEVEAKCPAALKRNASEDEVEFNVDELSAELLHELVNWINQTKAGGSGKKKKPTAASATSSKKTKAAPVSSS